MLILPVTAGCRTARLDPPAGFWSPRAEAGSASVAGLPLPPSGQELDPDPDLEVFTDHAWSLAETAEIRTWPWPDYVTARERRQIEDSIHAALETGGREGVEAEDLLVELDLEADASRFRAVGRLISQFVVIQDTWGLDNPEGLSRAMVIDRVLRRIDGVQERDFGDRLGIRAQTTEAHALGVIRHWNWWLEHQAGRQRRAPWDPLQDLVDPEDMGEAAEDRR